MSNCEIAHCDDTKRVQPHVTGKHGLGRGPDLSVIFAFRWLLMTAGLTWLGASRGGTGETAFKYPVRLRAEYPYRYPWSRRT